MNQQGDTKRIEWTEKGGVKIGIEVKSVGDIDRVSAAEFKAYVTELGWAKCCETGVQGERKPGSAKLDVQSVKQKSGKK